MKINRYQPVQPYTNNYQTAKSDEQNSSTSGPLKTNDKVEISTAAKRLQGTQKLEEARQEKIEQIKAQVENGTYHVPSAKIAEKMYGFWNK
ncbi:flagellar biosynthesis anti-sigma factor FlgM [Sporolactobacillus nakayamae]|uniref:Negative regulator of flagellin synthesis n=1 Tax=Sporolactobacillus nakayamae TaxID=269670 RepID=A0A1I2U9T9_9BACL|nr:flagellar biosynthesis anti-sigma factor FlgM [Sporolactobacillus nakayamae]SFG73159.1 anti-sigma-28 factor, FlgM family [Sporolactobacillus nakayamae]